MNHARPTFDEENADEWTYYHFCEECDGVFRDIGDNSSGNCPICAAGGNPDIEIKRRRYITPEAFAPLIMPHHQGKKSVVSDKTWDNHWKSDMMAEDHSRQSGLTSPYRSRPRMPTPQLDANVEDPNEEKFVKFWGGKKTVGCILRLSKSKTNQGKETV